MALIRGKDSLFPCPCCLVPKSMQSDLSVTYPAHTPEKTLEILFEANKLKTKTAQNDLLKNYGLHPFSVSVLSVRIAFQTDCGQNVFFRLMYTDPYRALSFDNLHFDSSGLWGAHIFVQLKEHVKLLGNAACFKVDSQSVPLLFDPASH